MKTIEIIGKNYLGKWNRTRTACRGIIVDGDRILLVYEPVKDQWMIPGGGVEGTESDRECCIREIAEETGILCEPSECLLEIDEYYEDVKPINRYFFCRQTGTTERKLTEAERAAGTQPIWISISEAKEIFAKHQHYAATDEMRRGLYQREYTALTELLGK